jgi:hypothetical protein
MRIQLEEQSQINNGFFFAAEPIIMIFVKDYRDCLILGKYPSLTVPIAIGIREGVDCAILWICLFKKILLSMSSPGA